MNEVEKMYSNAGIKKIGSQYANNVSHHLMTYPPFTAEKQIELIRWMIKTSHRYFIQDIIADDFPETLAGVFNLYWQDLTEEERKQLKGILE